MKASAIFEHFISIADWVDTSDTVDKIIIGDPDAVVEHVVVTWISSFDALRVAADRNCQMLITHGPTFWEHYSELDILDRVSDSPGYRLALRKKEFAEEHGLVVLRLHDIWDLMPEIGIPWAWASFLGLGDAPTAVSDNAYQHRYDIEPLPLDAFARRVADRTASLGEPAVQVVGRPEQTVSRVGIGTGCGCNPQVFRQMGCDVSVVCDDGATYWQDIQYAADNEHSVIRVNHGTSEEPGMATLTQYINDTLPDLKAELLAHGACFRLVGHV